MVGKNKILKLIIGSFLLFKIGFGISLKTYFVSVEIENLKIGKSYNICELANLPFTVHNVGEETIDLKIEPIFPQNLKESYEAIPELSWVEIIPNVFYEIEPNESIKADIIITIPDDERHLGKKYQVEIWSHSGGVGGVACGLASKVFFSVDTTREETAEVTVLPTEVVYLLDKEAKPIFFKFHNLTNQKKECKLRIIELNEFKKLENKIEIKDGYLFSPNFGCLKLEKKDFILNPQEKKKIKVEISFPREKKSLQKKYVFILQSVIKDKGKIEKKYNKIYVSLAPPNLNSEEKREERKW